MQIFEKRKAALALLRQGVITQAEAAQLLGESRQGVGYMARDIDCRAARLAFIETIWKKEIAKHGT